MRDDDIVGGDGHVRVERPHQRDAVAFVPYLALAVTMCLGLLLGDRTSSPARRQWGAAAAGSYVLIVIANFGWLLPVLSAEVIPYAEWAQRMWWKSWI